MGTRADFYVGNGERAKWLGSVGWDGYQWEKTPDCALMKATTETDFIEAVNHIARDRDDWSSPENGWPWPWNDSFTTDRVYAFVDGKTQAYHWGKVPTDDEDEDDVLVCGWPDMSDRQNVTMGVRSGMIVVRGK